MNVYIDKLKNIILKKNQNADAFQTSDTELWLKKYPIKTFIDIGAYVGEYVKFSQRLYPHSKIYAFEPLSEPFKMLTELKNKSKNLTIYNFALSDKNTKQTFYKSSYPPSSSLLQMDKLHKKSFPFSSGSKRKIVNVRTLDSVFKELFLEKEIFIKIDTQGNEGKIIDGGKNIIKQARIIQLEVSFYSLYRKQPLFHDIYQKLYRLGFLFHGMKNQILSPIDGTILQSHVYFINRSI